MANSELQNEYAIISCCLNNKEAAIRAVGALVAEDFDSPQCKEAFEHIRVAINNGDNIDETILKNKINSKQFNDVYNKFIKAVQVNYGYFQDYLSICKEHGKKRRLDQLIQRVQLDINKTSTELIFEIENELLDIQKNADNKITTLYDEISGIQTYLDSDTPHQEAVVGLNVIDNRLLLEPGSLTLVGGRPSMGKTAFLLFIAQSNAMRGKKVLLFSIEMNKRSLTKRIAGASAGIPLWKMQDKRKWTEEDSKKFKKWHEQVAPTFMHNIYVEDQANTLDQIISLSKGHFIKNPYDVILIDYIGLICKTTDRNSELGLISGSLKSLAKNLNIPLIAASQLNRSIKDREDKRPELTDLRDSGNLEQDSDVVMFCHREGYYDRSKPQNNMEIIVAKQRNGETFDQTIGYNRKTQVFTEFPK